MVCSLQSMVDGTSAFVCRMLARRSDDGAATVLLLSDNMLKYICYINLSIIIIYLAQKLGVWHTEELAQICRYHFASN